MCLAKLAPSLKLITVDVCWFEVVQITFFGKHNKVAAAVVCKKKKHHLDRHYVMPPLGQTMRLGSLCVKIPMIRQ